MQGFSTGRERERGATHQLLYLSPCASLLELSIQFGYVSLMLLAVLVILSLEEVEALLEVAHLRGQVLLLCFLIF